MATNTKQTAKPKPTKTAPPKIKTKTTKPKKATKPAKEKGVKFNDAQFDIILDGFYGGMTDNILDLVFDAPREDLTEEMIDFIAQKTVNELDFPTTDEALKAKVDAIMKEDGENMAQDLIFNQVKMYMEAEEGECGECDECKAKAKAAAKASEFNKKRGLC